MPFLALTPGGLAAALDDAAKTNTAIWCGNDILSAGDLAAHVERGVRLTRLAYPLTRATREMMIRTLATIERRHPGEPIWVESAGRGYY